VLAGAHRSDTCEASRFRPEAEEAVFLQRRLNRPYDIAGNVWVANYESKSAMVLIGPAAPTPLVAAVAQDSSPEEGMTRTRAAARLTNGEQNVEPNSVR